jgi:hypothetical protein
MSALQQLAADVAQAFAFFIQFQGFLQRQFSVFELADDLLQEAKAVSKTGCGLVGMSYLLR